MLECCCAIVVLLLLLCYRCVICCCYVAVVSRQKVDCENNEICDVNFFVILKGSLDDQALCHELRAVMRV